MLVFWTFDDNKHEHGRKACTHSHKHIRSYKTEYNVWYFILWPMICWVLWCVFTLTHTHARAQNRTNMFIYLLDKPKVYVEATRTTEAAIEKYIVHANHVHRGASNLFIYYFIMLKWPQITKQPAQSRASEWKCNCLFIYLFIHRVNWACVCVCCNCRFGK